MARRTISVEILGDYSSLQKAFKGASGSAQRFDRDLSRSARGALAASVSFRGMGRSIAFASSQFLGGAGLVYAFKQIISETSRVQEETEKTGVVFGQNARQVQVWSTTLAQSFGVSEGAALKAAGTFGNMLRPLGFGSDAAAKMSERLVELAADMASFNNVKPEVVLQALSSGLAGQVRPLRQYGVFLSETRIKEEALADGITKNAAHLTQAQKVQAAYNIILKDTKNAQGDVARNTGSLSVAMSKLTAGIQDTEAGLGSALLPTLTQYVNKAAAWLNQTDNQKRIQEDFNEAIRVTGGIVKDASGAIRGATGAVGGFKNALELLLALKVASTVGGWSSALVAYNGTAKTAEERSLALRATLARLAAIGVITIGIELVLNKDKIDKGVSSFLNKHGLGFLNGGKINLPKGTTAGDVETLIAQAKAAGAPSLEIEALQKYEKFLQSKVNTKGPAATVGAGPHHDAAFAGSLVRANKTETTLKTKRPLSLQGQLNLAELDIAQAGTTKSVKDDLAELRKKAAILHAMIAKGGTLAQQTQRNQDLASVLDQINAIEQAGQKTTEKQRKKQVDLLKKEASAEKKAADARKKALQSALDTAKGVIGELGQGPVATSQLADTIRSFGGRISAQMFTQDIAAQNQQTAGFLANLHKLSSRGAPSGLVQSLLSQGQGGMDEAAALAGASKHDLKVFLSDYRKRQKLLTQVARMEVSTPQVHVTAGKVTVGKTDAHDRPGDRFQTKASKGRRR